MEHIFADWAVYIFVWGIGYNAESGQAGKSMGFYLNSEKSYEIYRSEVLKPYFVDKTLILEELCPLAEQGNNHICITRPRRFGKTVMANMISAFFSRGTDSAGLFGRLAIAKSDVVKHRNQHNVIHIDFSKYNDECVSYRDYIANIKELLREDLHNAYPGCGFREKGTVSEDLMRIYLKEKEHFLFVLDEWDAVFHMSFVTQEDKRAYLLFLKDLLKDQPYVSLAYMTGVLPVAKYSSGSELNMFLEFSMTVQNRFSNYFGFTEAEVVCLYGKYLQKTEKPFKVDLEGLREWYNGYHTVSGERVYNPRSVVAALSNNQLADYWTGSGPYDEIFYYIKRNVNGVKEDIAYMVSGEAVTANIQEYAATSMNLQTKNEIFSAMVVYGFLSYEKGKVSIPNKELMDRFDDMVRKETSLGYVNRLARESDRMLEATLSGDTETMAGILAFVHDTETPLFAYNSEAELSSVVNLIYLSARDRYRVEREDKAGIGYVDFIFYPRVDKRDAGIILELKVDHTPEEAIEQIKEKKYALRFQGKLGEEKEFGGPVLAVGIGYNKKTKKHGCKVEQL